MQATSVARQLLAFSSKQVLDPKVLDLNTVVAEMHTMLRRLIGENIEFSITLDSAVGYIKADPGQIEQVVMNLAVNARDAMPRGGTLAIRTGVDSPPAGLLPEGMAAPPDGWVSLASADMSPDELDLIGY